MNFANNNTNIILLFSDSLSSLNSIANKKLDRPTTLQILLKYHNLFTLSFNPFAPEFPRIRALSPGLPSQFSEVNKSQPNMYKSMFSTCC